MSFFLGLGSLISHFKPTSVPCLDLGWLLLGLDNQSLFPAKCFNASAAVRGFGQTLNFFDSKG